MRSVLRSVSGQLAVIETDIYVCGADVISIDCYRSVMISARSPPIDGICTVGENWGALQISNYLQYCQMETGYTRNSRTNLRNSSVLKEVI